MITRGLSEAVRGSLWSMYDCGISARVLDGFQDMRYVARVTMFVDLWIL